MRIKKMLAVLAAISMLASMGISAAAEDETAATTTVTAAEEAVTTAATEATTLTETEITTSTEETTAETTTDSETETTVATEENETVEEVSEDETHTYATKTYQMGENGEHVLKAVLYSYPGITSESGFPNYGFPILYLSIYMDDKISNLEEVAVYPAESGTNEAKEYLSNMDNFFAITGVDEIAITAYGVTTNYNYYSGQFVKVGETITTTTPTTSTTTTTTTVTSGEIVVDGIELSRYAFSLNGINFTAVLFEEKWNGVSADLNYLLTIYKGSSATNLDSIIVNYKYDIETESSSTDVKDYISVLNDTVTVSIHNGTTTSYIYDTAKNAFVEAASSVQPTVLEIYENDSLTVTGTLSYEWDEAYMSFKHAILTLDTPITVKYMDGEWAGKTETIDSVQIAIEDELAEGTRLKVTGNVMYAHTGHHLRNIVLMDCSYKVLGKNEGKTDSGSTSKPSTNNTTGTPKTGDVATLPAVALGLTMTAAGVAAIIYKNRK